MAIDAFSWASSSPANLDRNMNVVARHPTVAKPAFLIRPQPRISRKPLKRVQVMVDFVTL